MNEQKQQTHEYLHHLVNRAQGQELMARAGTGEDRTEEIIQELGELSGIISKAYGHALAALSIRIKEGMNAGSEERSAATG